MSRDMIWEVQYLTHVEQVRTLIELLNFSLHLLQVLKNSVPEKVNERDLTIMMEVAESRVSEE